MTLGLDPGAVYDLTRKGIQLIKEFEGIDLLQQLEHNGTNGKFYEDRSFTRGYWE